MQWNSLGSSHRGSGLPALTLPTENSFGDPSRETIYSGISLALTVGDIVDENEVKAIVEKVLGERILQDSVEVGSPSKGGSVKVYFNAANLEDAKQRAENAVKVRDSLVAAMSVPA